MSRLAKNEKHPRFNFNNPMIKCDMSFLANFGVCNPFQDLKLQNYYKLLGRSRTTYMKYNFYW